MSTYAQNADLGVPSPSGALGESTVRRRSGGPHKLARGLGWFSIGLGVAELLAPGWIAGVVGSRNHRTLIRAYGVREIAAGVGILVGGSLAPWLWARVGGDAVDLVTLGKVLASPRNDAGKATFAIGSVAGVTALDVLCARDMSK